MPEEALGELGYLKRIILSRSALTTCLGILVSNFLQFSGFASATVLGIGGGEGIGG